jgi:sodium/proline symporter
MSAVYDVSSKASAPYGFLTIISTLAWGLGYFGMPHILLRFMAIEDEKKLTLSRRIASVWVVISMCVAIMIGIVGLGMSNAGAIDVLKGSASETIIVKISALLSTYGIIPALIAGLILAGILASTMSTADSQLLAASSAVSKNILDEVFGLKLDSKHTMLVARGTLFVIAVIGVIIARNPNSSVFGIVSFAWAGFGASFGPVVLFALFWRRSNKNGALAGMIVGGVMVFVWKYCIRPIGGAWNIYELLPAFICACIAIVVVSLVTSPPSEEITDEFDKVNN